MKKIACLQAAFLPQERPWSWPLFGVLCVVYLVAILLVALPDGMGTLLVSYGISDPAHNEHTAAICATKDCGSDFFITPRSTARDYIAFFDGGDQASYVRGGMVLAGMEGGLPSEVTKGFTEMSYYGRVKLLGTTWLSLWPPGMPVINSLPLLFNTDAPLGLAQIILMAVFWAMAFAVVVGFLAMRMRVVAVAAWPFVVMAFPLFYSYFFRYGVMLTETFASAFMVMGFSFLFYAYYRHYSRTAMLLAGLFFAASSFMRAQMFPASIGLTALLIIAYWIKRRRGTVEAQSCLSGAAIVFFMIGLYLPIGGYMAINHGRLFGAGNMWEDTYKFAPYPEAGPANYVVLGGSRGACELDLKECDRIRQGIEAGTVNNNDARAATIKAILQHPIAFTSYKLPIVWRYWFAESGFSAPVVTTYRTDNAIILTLLLVGFGIFIVQRRWLPLSLGLAVCALIIAPPFVFHFEIRYLFPIKAYALFLPLWLLLAAGGRQPPLPPRQSSP